VKNRKRREKKSKRNSSTHRFANTAERNIPPRRKMNAGNLTRMPHHAQHHGSQPKAPEGTRGLK
jgi:hypothetical protein